MVKCCATCGQTMPLPPSASEGLSPRRRMIFEAVERAGHRGIATERLVALLYADDPNGGPLHAVKSLHVLVCNINSKIRPLGWQIEGWARHPGFYVLEHIATPASALIAIRKALE